MEKIPENHPWVFQKWTILRMSKKKIFKNYFQGLFSEIKYYKDLSKNQGIFNILCGWLQKIPRRGMKKVLYQ